MPRRTLIVNADDFGQSEAVNRGVIRAHESGIVTSASLMVRWPAASAAAGYARAHRDLSLGVHLDLGEWTFEHGRWRALYRVAAEPEAEFRSQFERFRELVGCDPTHIDSHQHVHRDEPARSAAVELARMLGVPLRSFDSRVRYCGDFYGQLGDGTPYPEGVTVERLLEIVRRLPPGITELGCHPADEPVPSMYAHERVVELEALCDPRVRACIDAEAVELRSYLTLE